MSKRSHHVYTPEAAREIVATAPLRITQGAEVERFGRAHRPIVVQIYVDGKWRVLCRTDQADDVCTSREPPIDAAVFDGLRAEYQQRAHLGARQRAARNQDRDLFCCIDSYTDG